MSRYVVGVDVGTESVRAAVVDPEGHFLGTGTVPISTTHPQPGWAEQSPAEWRKAFVGAVRAAVSASHDRGVLPQEIAAIAADGTTCTVVLVGPDGEPLRNALLWMDVRSHEEAAIVSQTGDPALKITGGGPVSAEWLPAKLLWLHRHESDTLARTSTVMELTSWLILQMTGNVVADACTASMRWFYDSRTGLPDSLYTAAGLSDVLYKLPELYATPGEIVGTLIPEVAQLCGLPAGLPVVAGAADAPAALVGMGVTAPGRVGLITGSSHVHLALCEEQTHVAGLFGGYPDAIVPGTHLLEGGQVSTGSVLKWFVTQFTPDGGAREAFAELDESASRITPGSEGLLVIDHFQGNRTPWSDPTSRGVIRGLTLSHTRAHVYRAILEGVAYGTAVVLSRMKQAGIESEHLVMCGGATSSRLWTQIHADVAGCEIRVPEQQQAAALGSAMLASVGAGIYPNLAAAGAAMVRIRESVTPDMNRHDRYETYVNQCTASYTALADLSRELVRFENPG